MNKSGVLRRAMVAAVLAFGLISVVGTPVLLAQEATPAAAASGMSLAYFGAAVGLGMIVIGAGLGIGKFAAAAAEGIARQPAAAAQITGAVNLPLFLLEGVAILAEVGVLLSYCEVVLSRGWRRRRDGTDVMDNPLVQPDPGLFIWTILTFLVLLRLLAKFAWRPLLQASRAVRS